MSNEGKDVDVETLTNAMEVIQDDRVAMAAMLSHLFWMICEEMKTDELDHPAMSFMQVKIFQSGVQAGTALLFGHTDPSPADSDPDVMSQIMDYNKEIEYYGSGKYKDLCKRWMREQTIRVSQRGPNPRGN